MKHYYVYLNPITKSWRYDDSKNAINDLRSQGHEVPFKDYFPQGPKTFSKMVDTVRRYNTIQNAITNVRPTITDKSPSYLNYTVPVFKACTHASPMYTIQDAVNHAFFLDIDLTLKIDDWILSIDSNGSIKRTK